MQKEFIAAQEINISFKVPENCEMKRRCQGMVWFKAGKGMQERWQRKEGGKGVGSVGRGKREKIGEKKSGCKTADQIPAVHL